MSDTGGTPVAEVVVQARPIRSGEVPMPPPGGGPDRDPQNPTITDPQYSPPTDPPDPLRFRSPACYARNAIKRNQTIDGHPNAEYAGVVYRGNDGTYYPSDFFYVGQTGGSYSLAIDWLQQNQVSTSNLVGEIHNHTRLNDYADAINRLPSPADESDARSKMNQYGLPGYLVVIIDPDAKARVYTLDQMAHFNAMTNDQKSALTDAQLPPVLDC